MKKLKLIFTMKDIKEYQDQSGNILDIDVQDIVTSILDVVNEESDTTYLFDMCYFIEYTTEEVTEEQKEEIIAKVEEIIDIHSANIYTE